MPERRARPGRMLRGALLFPAVVLALACRPARAQEPPADSVAHSPVKATLLSMALPGAGQFYNRKYWKIPVIYGAFAGLGYLVKFNDDRFQTYRKAYILRIDGKPETVDDFVDRYSDADLKTLRDFYRRNRDLSYIFAGLVYVLNIVDASVDAHLYYFDVSDDLSLRLDPVWQPLPGGPQAPGMQLTLRF
jgi:hypothetical protein